MSGDVSARISRTRSERVAPDGVREPVLAEEISVASGGMSVAQLWAFSEALAAAGAESSRMITVEGAAGNPEKHLRCTWRQILPGDDPK